MAKKLRWLCIPLMVFALTVVIPGQALAAENNGTDRAPGLQRVIVMFYDSVDPASTSADLGKKHDLNVVHVYEHALNGFSCFVPAARLAALQADPRVKLVEPDLIAHTTGQVVPTGIQRIQADLNSIANINGIDDRVDVDIAILDTGIDMDHPDLNVVGGRHFYSLLGIFQYEDGNYDDDNGHGSHVAGIAAALDNDYGVVGVAPGARLWAVKVLDSGGSGYLSDIAAGVDYVTAHANEIEVANMSLEWPGNSVALRSAISNSVMAGVVYYVAAGNGSRDIYGSDGIPYTSDDIQPASYVEAATVSAMVDSDGTPGGDGSSTSHGPDDSFASFSNFSAYDYVSNYVNSPGLGIDLMMPGVYITSTYMNGGYATMSGTSMASPHAAGLAALYIAENGRATSMYETSQLRQALIDAGMPQDDAQNGLSVLNDPDGNTENIGWAGPSEPPATEAPAVTTQPDDQTVVEGQTVSFTTAASGTPTPTVQWQLSTDDGSNWSNIDGATSTTYTTPITTLDMNGYQYQAVFTNTAGSVITDPATLTVNEYTEAPAVTTQPDDQTVVEGQTASFTAAASGTPTPTVQWQLSIDDGSNWSNIDGATSTTYTTPITTLTMSGYQYQAVFTNSVGYDTTVAAILTVTEQAAEPDINVTIDMSTGSRSAGKNTFVWAIATITVSIDGSLAEGATVEGHWDSATTDIDIGTTDANGEVSLQSDAVKNPSSLTTFIFVVDSVTISGTTYEIIDTSGSIDI